MMGHRDFDDPVSLHLNQRRHEPMHSIKDRDVLEALSLEDPQGTCTVVNSFPTQPIPDGIPNPRGNPLKPRVFPLLAPTCGHVVAVEIALTTEEYPPDHSEDPNPRSR